MELKPCGVLRWLALAFLLPHSTDSESSGAPQSACSDLMPQHGSAARTTPSPYAITFTPSNFTAGGSKITVTLSTTSGVTFKGFLLTTQYDESCNDQTLMPGTFTAIANTHLACNNGAVTQSSINTQSTLSFQWTPPATSKGHIRFRATFVQQKSIFWVNVKAADVLVDSAVGAGQSSCSGTPTTSTPTTSTPTTSTPTTKTPSTSTGTITKDPQCGLTKGCYSDCSGTDCNFLMMWQAGTAADNVRITIKGKTGTTLGRYIAFGLSNDQSMGEDSVHYCVNSGTEVYSAYNQGYTNEPLTNIKDGVSNFVVTFANGVLTCTFTRTKAAGQDLRLFALDKPYTIFWAQGQSGVGYINRHDSQPIVSVMAVSLLDFTVDISGGVDIPLVKAHGSIMLVAWILCASIGVVMARYYKNVWEDQKLFGQKIWFQVHRACMVLCVLTTVISFIIIFVESDGYSDIEGEAYKKAHPVIGIIVTGLAVINPIMALFRPHPGTKNRPIFNWLHWAVGFGAYCLAVIALFFGMKLEKSGAPEYAIYILAAFVVWQGLIHIVLEIVQLKARNSGDSNKYEMTDVTQRPAPVQSSPQASIIKPMLLILHVVVVIGFTIALIIVINVGKNDDD